MKVIGEIWERIKKAWQVLVERIKKVLKRDAPRLKWTAGQRLYVNGSPYIIVGMNLDIRGHIDLQLESEPLYYAKRAVVPLRVDPSILKEDLR